MSDTFHPVDTNKEWEPSDGCITFFILAVLAFTFLMGVLVGIFMSQGDTDLHEEPTRMESLE